MVQLIVRLPGRHEVVGSNLADALHFSLAGVLFTFTTAAV